MVCWCFIDISTQLISAKNQNKLTNVYNTWHSEIYKTTKHNKSRWKKQQDRLWNTNYDKKARIKYTNLIWQIFVARIFLFEYSVSSMYLARRCSVFSPSVSSLSRLSPSSFIETVHSLPSLHFSSTILNQRFFHNSTRNGKMK